MERAALIGGIILAVIVAIGAMLPHGAVVRIGGWDDGEGSVRRAAYVEPAPGRMEAQRFPVTRLLVRHAAAVVEITPEARDDIAIEIDNPGSTPMPTVRRDGDRLIVDGLLARRIDNCTDEDVSLEGYGRVARSALPRIRVRAPLDVDVRLHGAVYGRIGEARTLDLEIAQCSEAQVGDVSGNVQIDVAGAGDVQAGSAAAAEIDISGSGSVRIGATRGSLNLDLAGSGSAHVTSFEGDDVEIDVAGAGNANVGALRARSLVIDVAGSGEVQIGDGAVSDAEISIAGSGDVDMATSVARLEVNTAGSGDVVVRREVRQVEANLVGSGDVIVPSQPAMVDKSSIGSGDIVVRASVAAPASVSPPAAPAPAPPPAPAPQ